MTKSSSFLTISPRSPLEIGRSSGANPGTVRTIFLPRSPIFDLRETQTKETRSVSNPEEINGGTVAVEHDKIRHTRDYHGYRGLRQDAFQQEIGTLQRILSLLALG